MDSVLSWLKLSIVSVLSSALNIDILLYLSHGAVLIVITLLHLFTLHCRSSSHWNFSTTGETSTVSSLRYSSFTTLLQVSIWLNCLFCKCGEELTFPWSKRVPQNQAHIPQLRFSDSTFCLRKPGHSKHWVGFL